MSLSAICASESSVLCHCHCKPFPASSPHRHVTRSGIYPLWLATSMQLGNRQSQKPRQRKAWSVLGSSGIPICLLYMYVWDLICLIGPVTHFTRFAQWSHCNWFAYRNATHFITITVECRRVLSALFTFSLQDKRCDQRKLRLYWKTERNTSITILALNKYRSKTYRRISHL